MSKLFSLRTFVLAALAAAAAYALKSRSSGAPAAPVAYTPPSPSPAPVPSNADVAGPPENTATAVPAPEPQTPDAVDEAAEIEAAAAEAANIGGPAPEYPVQDEADRAVEEAGGGESEGQELAEADLVEHAEDPGGAVEEILADEIPAEELPPPPVDPPAAPDDKSTAVWRNEDQPTVEQPAVDDNK